MKEVIKYLDENKAIAPFIGAIVVIITFMIDRIINHSIRKKQIRRDWYTKFLVERNLTKIDEFYSKVCDQYEQDANLLTKNEGEQYILNKEFQDLKEKFESEVISLLVSSDESQLYQIINSVIIPLSDIVIGRLGEKKISIDDIKESKNMISKNKSTLMKILFKPLK